MAARRSLTATARYTRTVDRIGREPVPSGVLRGRSGVTHRYLRLIPRLKTPSRSRARRPARPLSTERCPWVASHEGSQASPVVSTGSWVNLRPERGSRLDHVAVLRFDHGPVLPRVPARRGKGPACRSVRWPWPSPRRVRPALPGTCPPGWLPCTPRPTALCTSTTSWNRRPMLVPPLPQRYVADRARRRAPREGTRLRAVVPARGRERPPGGPLR
jgi:hypothetical protein